MKLKSWRNSIGFLRPYIHFCEWYCPVSGQRFIDITVGSLFIYIMFQAWASEPRHKNDNRRAASAVYREREMAAYSNALSCKSSHLGEHSGGNIIIIPSYREWHGLTTHHQVVVPLLLPLF